MHRTIRKKNDTNNGAVHAEAVAAAPAGAAAAPAGAAAAPAGAVAEEAAEAAAA